MTTTNEFVFNRASDNSVDSEYVLLRNPNITIQHCPYDRAKPYCVNVWIEAEEAMDHYPVKTLVAAKAKALDLAKGV